MSADVESVYAGILQAMGVYADAVDRADLAALRRLITDDAVLERRQGTHEGPAEFLSVYEQFAANRPELSRHVVTNVRVEVQDDYHAQAHAYFQAWGFNATNSRVIVGTYQDTFRRTGGTWLLCRKVINIERVLALPGAELPPAAL
jgi:ketosteroid isomerase-like protein